MSNILDQFGDTNKSIVSADATAALLDNVEDDTFFQEMSPAARTSMNKSFNDYEVSVSPKKQEEAKASSQPPVEKEPEAVEENVEETKESKELFNNNIVGKKPRGRHKKEIEESVDTSMPNYNYDIIMNQIAKNVINDLQQSKYTMSGFTNAQMKVIFDYMIRKF